MIREIRDGNAFCICRNMLADGTECGREFVVPFQTCGDEGMDKILHTSINALICEQCREKEAEDERVRQGEEQKHILAESLSERMERTGIPPRFRAMDKPWTRPAAEWIFRHRNESLLIAGETGVGKTSSACFVIRWMMRQQFLRVRYYTRQTLIAEFVQSKTSDNDNELRFMHRLDQLDYLIIDELIGKKGEAKLSPSGQELLFNIVDGVYSWARGTKVWILGNFQAGSIDRLVDDPRPFRRRFQESFRIAWFDGDSVDESLKVFDENQTEED